MAVFLQANLAEKPTFSNFRQGLHNMLRLKGRALDFVYLGISARNTKICQDGNVGKKTNGL
jgi:hypothetical protein